MNLTRINPVTGTSDHHVEEQTAEDYMLAVDRFWHRHGEIRGKSLCTRCRYAQVMSFADARCAVGAETGRRDLVTGKGS
jgi:hypothetical protein